MVYTGSENIVVAHPSMKHTIDRYNNCQKSRVAGAVQCISGEPSARVDLEWRSYFHLLKTSHRGSPAGTDHSNRMAVFPGQVVPYNTGESGADAEWDVHRT